LAPPPTTSRCPRKSDARQKTYSYDPYGNPTGSTGGITQPFGYAGEYTDQETGMVYLRARYYDPGTGQFLNRDPIESVTGAAYAYVGGNPINRVDPTGLEWWDPKDWSADDTWDETGGRAVSWVADNPGTAATIVGVGVCIVGSLGACGAAAAGAWAVRSGERVVEDGFRDSLGVNLADGLITYATFGLVSAPASYGLARGGTQAIPGVLAAGEQGIMAGSPFWLQALVRGFSVTPDLAGLFGGSYFGDGC
jgi:RHS repeat-associated protein